VLMAGSDYGPGVGNSTCSSDVTVIIDGSPCDNVTMSQVSSPFKVQSLRAFSPCETAITFTLRSLPMRARDRVQPHSQLLCATRQTRGMVRIVTAAGVTSPVLYDSSELLQPPIVGGVAPLVWSPSEPTTVVISGERWVRCSWSC
jgi:hypothetical protein